MTYRIPLQVLHRAVSVSLCCALFLLGSRVAAQPVDVPQNEPALIHHSLKVVLDPQNQSISVEDSVTLPDAMLGSDVNFSLNSNLRISNNYRRLQALTTDPAMKVLGINNTSGLAGATTATSIRRGSRNASRLGLI